MSIDAMIERSTNDEAAKQAGLVRAAARTAGRYYLGGDVPETHRCKPAAYRMQDWGITLLCDYGHSAGAWVNASNPVGAFGGSAFQASLNDLPAGAPFVAIGS